jgi:hypothetical protein
MSCDLLNGGIEKGCGPNLGGLKKVYITNLENVDPVPTVTAGEISAITMTSGAVFYEFAFPKNTSSFTEDLTSDITTGSEFWTSTLTLVFTKREAAKREKIALLAGQRDLAIIVQDQNDTYWYMGLSNGMTLTQTTGGSGTTKTDLNGYTLTFTGEEMYQMPEVDSSIIAGLL